MTYLAKEAARVIKERAQNFIPKIGIICGSGLGALAEAIESPIIIPYTEIPGFPQCSVEGHGGNLFLGLLKGVPVVCLQGRAHYYEGVDNEAIQTLVRTLKLLGCETLVATNSAGSLRPAVKPGSLVIINDHINMQFRSVLSGPNDDEFGPRFIGLEDAYDPKLRQQFHTAGQSLGLNLHEGVYIAVLGPFFETPAEIRAFATLGADMVGMSTVPEVIVARHCGLRVAAISVITNLAAGMNPQQLSHEETLDNANLASANLIQLILNFVGSYH